MALPTNSLMRNPRKQKLTEARGTNPSKTGGVAIAGAPTVGSVGDRRYGQDSAPNKTIINEHSFGVAGPGFPKPLK